MSNQKRSSGSFCTYLPTLATLLVVGSGCVTDLETPPVEAGLASTVAREEPCKDVEDGTQCWTYGTCQDGFCDMVCNGERWLCNLRYDEAAYAMAHNSYSSFAHDFYIPYVIANQSASIEDQLAAGVRALELDVYVETNPLTGNDHLILYHGEKLAGFMPLIDALNDVREFLDENPTEILTIVFEDGTPKRSMDGPELLAATFQAALLDDYLRTIPIESLEGEEEYVDWVQWPTLGEMVADGRRLVVMTSWPGYECEPEPGGAECNVCDSEPGFTHQCCIPVGVGGDRTNAQNGIQILQNSDTPPIVPGWLHPWKYGYMWDIYNDDGVSLVVDSITYQCDCSDGCHPGTEQPLTDNAMFFMHHVGLIPAPYSLVALYNSCAWSFPTDAELMRGLFEYAIDNGLPGQSDAVELLEVLDEIRTVAIDAAELGCELVCAVGYDPCQYLDELEELFWQGVEELISLFEWNGIDQHVNNCQAVTHVNGEPVRVNFIGVDFFDSPFSCLFDVVHDLNQERMGDAGLPLSP